MPRSGSQREPGSRVAGLVGGGLTATGAAIAHNPMLVGGSTAFIVVLFYVSANALWYQPYAHPGPLMQTRFVVEREEPRSPPAPSEPRRIETSAAQQEVAAPTPQPKPAAPGDPVVEKVQRALSDLNLYSGTVDGLAGPRTRKAIEEYQKLVGIEPTGAVSDELLKALAHPLDTGRTQSVPAPKARPEPAPSKDAASHAAAKASGDADVVKLQAGLRAFGNEGIELDGRLGDKTRSAIREFQSLFGLPVTGAPDPAVLAKMKEIGLTN